MYAPASREPERKAERGPAAAPGEVWRVTAPEVQAVVEFTVICAGVRERVSVVRVRDSGQRGSPKRNT